MRVAVIGCLLAATLALAAAAEPATATENFEEADLNHDGAVSLDEFKKYMSADHPANKAVSCERQMPSNHRHQKLLHRALLCKLARKMGFYQHLPTAW